MNRWAGALAAAATLVVAACGGPSDGDQTACETVLGPNDIVSTLIREDDPDSALIRQVAEGIPGDIDSALSVADDPTLTVELDRLAELADYEQRMSSETASMAYFMQLSAVRDVCADLGVESDPVR